MQLNSKVLYYCHFPLSPSGRIPIISHFFPAGFDFLCLASLAPSSGNLDRQTESGNTALHYCCIYEKQECLKLLLRGKPDIDIGLLLEYLQKIISYCHFVIYLLYVGLTICVAVVLW